MFASKIGRWKEPVDHIHLLTPDPIITNVSMDFFSELVSVPIVYSNLIYDDLSVSENLIPGSNLVEIVQEFLDLDLFFTGYETIQLSIDSTISRVPLLPLPPDIIAIDLNINVETIGFDIYDFDVDISNNIFLLLKAGKVRGKQYGFDEWKNAFTKATSKRRRRKRNAVTNQAGKKDRRDADEKIVDNPAIKNQLVPNFFDLIKPLLYPPPEFMVQQGADRFLPPGYKPYPYQIEGIKKLLENAFFLLADEMGTGKTVMAILAMRVLFRQGKIRSALILCPVSVLRVWEEHVYRWSKNELAYVKVRGVKNQRDLIWNANYHVCITSYDTYRRDNVRLSGKIDINKFDLVVLDEAHLIKNKSTKRYKAVKRINHKIMWALTGTPLENSIEDVKSIFSLMKQELISKEITSPQRVRDLISPFMLRRLKKDVLEDLPPKTRQVIWLEMSEDQKNQYQNILKHGVAKLSELHANHQNVKIHIFALLNKLKQVSNFPKGSIQSPKIEAAKDIIEEVRSSGNKALIFSQYLAEGINKIEENLSGYGIQKYTGSMTPSKRDYVIDDFKNNPDIHVLLISTRAGSLGLNLTEASYVIHFDHWWNPAIMSQAEDRAHRAGQESRVTVYELWMEAPIEERIYKKLEQKQMLAQQVIDANASQGLTKDDIFTTDEWLFDIFQINSVNQEKSEQVKKSINSNQIDLSDLNSIKSSLQKLSPEKFEKLIAKLFKSLGYGYTEHVGKSHDGGIDIIAERFYESKREKIIIQCKRYKNNVGVKTAREIIGSMQNISNCKRAYLVTTSGYSLECKKYAASMGDQLKLYDGDRIARYVHDLNLVDDLIE